MTVQIIVLDGMSKNNSGISFHTAILDTAGTEWVSINHSLRSKCNTPSIPAICSMCINFMLIHMLYMAVQLTEYQQGCPQVDKLDAYASKRNFWQKFLCGLN